MRLTKLTPKHTEKQSVPLCLQIFCDETDTALRTHTATKDEDGIEETATFIEKVVKFWKICNVKSKYQDVLRNNPFRGVIEDENDPKLVYLVQFGEMCLKMKSTTKHRVKQLTRHTALATLLTINFGVK